MSRLDVKPQRRHCVEMHSWLKTNENWWCQTSSGAFSAYLTHFWQAFSCNLSFVKLLFHLASDVFMGLIYCGRLLPIYNMVRSVEARHRRCRHSGRRV